MSLTLDIVRHGVAAAHHAAGDAHRALTPHGAEAIRRLATALQAEGWAPDRVFASPYVRAQQTAHLLAAPGGFAVDTLHELEPDTPPQRVLDALADEGIEAGHVVLVAHLPLVERLQLLLSAGSAPWMPGTIVRVELPSGLNGRGQSTRVWTP